MNLLVHGPRKYRRPTEGRTTHHIYTRVPTRDNLTFLPLKHMSSPSLVNMQLKLKFTVLDSYFHIYIEREKDQIVKLNIYIQSVSTPRIRGVVPLRPQTHLHGVMHITK